MTTIVVDHYEPTITELYRMRDETYSAAQRAVWRSSYLMGIRAHYLQLLKKRFERPATANIPRDIVTYRRVARFFARRRRE